MLSPLSCIYLSSHRRAQADRSMSQKKKGSMPVLDSWRWPWWRGARRCSCRCWPAATVSMCVCLRESRHSKSGEEKKLLPMATIATGRTMVVRSSHPPKFPWISPLPNKTTAQLSLLTLSLPNQQKYYMAMHETTYQTTDLEQCTRPYISLYFITCEYQLTDFAKPLRMP